MTRSLLAVVLALVFYVSASFGQGGIAVNIYYSPNEGDPLTTECDGSTPIPDGRIIRIFQDDDLNGPDPDDPQPVVCDFPPTCEGALGGEVNYNEFLMNGESMIGVGAGYFQTSPAIWQSYGGPPPGFPVFYLRIYEADGTTVLWTSSTFFVTAGGFSEVEIQEEDWTCGQGGVQCLVVDETE